MCLRSVQLVVDLRNVHVFLDLLWEIVELPRAYVLGHLFFFGAHV